MKGFELSVNKVQILPIPCN